MFKKILRHLDFHLEEYLLASLLVTLTIAMLLQVVMRYVFSSALSWPEEFCRYCFIYFSFLTLSYCIRMDSMLRLDVIKSLFPPKLWHILTFVFELVSLIFFVYFLIHSVDLVLVVKNTSRTSPAMGIPFYFIYISTVVGFGLAIFRSIQSMYRFFFQEAGIE